MKTMNMLAALLISLLSYVVLFAEDPLKAQSAEEAYLSLINPSNGIKTELEYNNIVLDYMEKYGEDFVYAAIKGCRGKEDLKKGEAYALGTRMFLINLVSRYENKTALVNTLVKLYESDSDTVFRDIGVPLALKIVLWDSDTEKISYSRLKAYMTLNKDNLPLQFIEGYMYKNNPFEALKIFSGILSTPEDAKMLKELSDDIYALQWKNTWPDDVSTYVEAKNAANKNISLIVDRNEWWIQLFVRRILFVKPNWATDKMGKMLSRPISFPNTKFGNEISTEDKTQGSRLLNSDEAINDPSHISVIILKHPFVVSDPNERWHFLYTDSDVRLERHSEGSILNREVYFMPSPVVIFSNISEIGGELLVSYQKTTNTRLPWIYIKEVASRSLYLPRDASFEVQPEYITDAYLSIKKMDIPKSATSVGLYFDHPSVVPIYEFTFENVSDSEVKNVKIPISVMAGNYEVCCLSKGGAKIACFKTLFVDRNGQGRTYELLRKR